MKIIFVTPSLELHGGNLCTVKYANYLASKGYQIKIITTDKPVKIEVDKRIEVVKYKHIRLQYFDFFTWQLCYLGKIVDLITDGDVVIPNHSPLLVPVIMARKKKELNYKILLFFQDSFQMIWVGWFLKILFKLDFVKKNIDKVVAVSEGQAKELMDYSGIKSVVISNGIDDVFKDYKTEKNKDILFVGRKINAKGYDVFVKAMNIVLKKYPEYKVSVLSPDDEDKRSRTEYAQIISKSFLYVNTSLAESFGLPSLEAMACGTPVVLTDTVGSRVYARDGVNCLVTKVGDYQETVKAVLRVIENDDLRKKMIENGKLTAEKFGWKKSLEIFEKTLINLD